MLSCHQRALSAGIKPLQRPAVARRLRYPTLNGSAMDLRDLTYTGAVSPRTAVAAASHAQAQTAHSHATGDAHAEAQAPLSSQPWVKSLGGEIVFDSRGVGPAPLYEELSADHLFLSLLEHHLIRDMVVSYAATTTTVHAAIRLGIPVCGHPRVVHGGLTSAIFDEVYGALLFNMRRQGQVAFDRVYTARLEVDYTSQLPAESCILCSASLESFEGRKIWVTASMTVAPTVAAAADQGGDGQQEGPIVYAKSRALFIIPRDDPGLLAAEAAAVVSAAGGPVSS